MDKSLHKSPSEFKRKLIFRYGSLLAASQALQISYHRLVNILNGRTELNSSEQTAFAAINEKISEQISAVEAR